MRETKLFICVTPFTALFAQELMTRFRMDGDTSEAVIATRPYPFLKPEVWDRTYYIENFRKTGKFDLYWYHKLIEDAAGLWAFVRDDLARRGGKTTIFLPTLDSLYTNRVFFSFRHRPNVSFAAIQDGTMNILARRVDTAIFKRQLLKWLLALFHGFTFRPYLGCLNGIDRHTVETQYLSFVPQAYNSKTQVVPLRVQKQGAPAGERSVLIIGQEPVIDMIGYDGYLAALRSIVSRIRTQFSDVLVYNYKFHPFCTVLHRKMVMDDLPEMIGSAEIDWLVDERPVEILQLAEMGVVGVYSVNSSGSVSLALLYSGSDIEMAIAGTELIYQETNKRSAMERFYSACGLRILDADGRLQNG